METPTQEELQQIWDQEAGSVDGKSVTTETPTTTEVVPDPAPTSTEAPPVDPTAKAVEELRSQNTELQERLRKQESNIGNIFQTLKRTQDELAAGKAAVGDTRNAPSSQQITAASASAENWGRLKEDFPEWATGIEERLALIPTTPAGMSEAHVQELMQTQEKNLRAAFAMDMAESRVEFRHPDWKATVINPEFRAWADKQTEEVKALGGSNNSRDAIRMLDLYEVAKTRPASQVTQERTQRLATAASTPRGNQGRVSKGPDDMTDTEWWEHLAKQKHA